MVKNGSTTLKDVAQRAGVSKAAASVALSGSSSNTLISETTRQRILNVANELRYVPNALARGLNGIRLKSLGVCFPTSPFDQIIIDPYTSSVLRGIINAAVPLGYNVTYFHRPWHDARQSASGFRSQGIDGFLIVAPLAGSDMVSGLSELGIPLVVISTSSEVHNVLAVDIDNAEGARLAMGHLLGLGHRRIAIVVEHTEQFDMAARRDTFLAVLAEAGIPVPRDYVQVVGAALTAGYDETRALLSLPEPPTAIFATNDGIAIAVMAAARDLGVRVPEQLSVIGFDDHPSAQLATPALTTLRQPLVEMGQSAATMLVSLVEGEQVPPRTHLFVPELIVRGSTAVLGR